MSYFYHAAAETEHTQIILSASESHHLVHVLRKASGDEIRVLNGSGKCFAATVSGGSGKAAQIQLGACIRREEIPAVRLCLAVAPTKNNDRMEWLTEKATELGVWRIQPVIMAHSERKHIRTDKWQQAAVAAMKQSGNVFLPQIPEPITLDQWLVQSQGAKNRFVGLQHAPSWPEHDAAWRQGEIQVLIGPEGGFSAAELEQLEREKVQPLGVSPNRLRVETAAVTVVAQFQFLGMKS